MSNELLMTQFHAVGGVVGDVVGGVVGDGEIL